MSSASASSSTTTLAEQRPEAEPLPRKIGEIGYVTPPKSPKTPNATQEVPLTPALPARHPADRDPSTTTPSSTDAPPPTAGNNSTSNTSPSTKKQKLTFFGISLFSWFRVLLLLLFLAGTSAAWGITIEVFSKTGGSSDSLATDDQDAQVNFDSSSDSSNDSGKPGSFPTSFSSIIIVHVSFTIVVLVELLFLERSIFHARAERYLHKRGMQSGEGGANMGFAPWNRPSLPTYAATLAETGARTGDVEDNLIAIPPPPAYGNTRGSVLLLSGFLRDSLVRNLNRSSQRSSQRSTTSQAQVATPREMEEGRESRPISYDASEGLDDARRAAQLEEALSKLENNGHTPLP